MRKYISSLFVVVVAALLSVFTACNKLSQSTNNLSGDTLIVKSNVIVVDTTQYTLVSTAQQLTDGTYVYLYKPSLADLRHNGDFTPGNIIIGATAEGYLRKIISSVNDVQSITLTTQQARLEDIFQQGIMSFNTGNADGGLLQYAFVNTPLYSDNNVTVQVASGNMSMNTLQSYLLQFKNSNLTLFSADCSNASLSANFKLSVVATGASSFNATDTLKTTSVTRIVQVGRVPLVFTAQLSLVAKVAGSVNGAVNDIVTVSNGETFNLNTSYSAGAWTNTNNFIPASSLTGSATPGAASISVSCNIAPLITVKFYGVNGSSLSLPLNNTLAGNKSATTADWDFNTGLSIQPAISESAAILGYSLTDYNVSWNTGTTNYITPYRLIKVSGDHQTAGAGNYLPQPVQVKVVDNNGNKQPNVKVYFTVTSGGGSMSYYAATSDANGIVLGYWQLGNGSGTQTLSASARKADGSEISGSPVIFTAN